MTMLTDHYVRPNLRIVTAEVTLEHVSREAGVSKSTASRALCDAPNVRSETRERVRRIAESLGYVPNEAARQLAARRVIAGGGAGVADTGMDAVAAAGG
jgi:hypothetical protein